MFHHYGYAYQSPDPGMNGYYQSPAGGSTYAYPVPGMMMTSAPYSGQAAYTNFGQYSQPQQPYGPPFHMLNNHGGFQNPGGYSEPYAHQVQYGHPSTSLEQPRSSQGPTTAPKTRRKPKQTTARQNHRHQASEHSRGPSQDIVESRTEEVPYKRGTVSFGDARVTNPGRSSPSTPTLRKPVLNRRALTEGNLAILQDDLYGNGAYATQEFRATPTAPIIYKK